MKRPAERRIAVFLDFENLVTNTGLTASSFDLEPALDRLLEKGKVVYRRAYCDWTRFTAAKAGLHTLGVDLIEVPPSTRAGKNSADMRLVIDALELCYAREHIDTFVIGSGDSDFCPLASKLRENDRIVVGLGVKKATSPLFVKACDEFIYLAPRAVRQEELFHKPSEPGAEDEEEPTTSEVTGLRTGGRTRRAADKKNGKDHHPEPAEKAAAERTAEKSAAEPGQAPAHGPEEKPPEKPEKGRRGGREERKKEKDTQKQAQQKVRQEARKNPTVPAFAKEIITRLLEEADEPVNPSAVKNALVRRHPDFDERDHGFPVFGRLLEALEDEGVLRRLQIKKQWYVAAPEIVAEPAGTQPRAEDRVEPQAGPAPAVPEPGASPAEDEGKQAAPGRGPEAPARVTGEVPGETAHQQAEEEEEDDEEDEEDDAVPF